MSFMQKYYVAALAITLSFGVHAADDDPYSKEKMLHSLDIIRNSFQVQYAPTEWKRNFSGWDLNEQIDKAKEVINANGPLNVKAFQRIVRDFFNSTQDYHVGVNFYSTEAATLPFRVKGADKRYFITFIDRSKLSPVVFPFQEGDELVEFDGKPTHDVLEEFKVQEVGNASETTDWALAELFLTTRIGALGHCVPKGPVMIKVKSQEKMTTNSYQIIWQHFPEKIQCKSADPTLPHFFSDILNKQMAAPFYQTLKEAVDITVLQEEDTEVVGSRRGFLPYLGKKWWESESSNPFHAYLYETPDRKLVGYIRIPHYDGDDTYSSEFAKILTLMEERSDALIIDQMNNPGGSVFYLYALASMLTDQPLSAPRHRMTITQREVMLAVTCIPIFEQVKSDDDARAVLGETLDGNTVTYQVAQFFLNYFRFIVDEWQEGRTLTNPFYLYGIDHINPNPSTRYTKPILVLANALDFSGGDFFPAIFQDNNRATILGQRTAGAGGFVIGTSFPNHFGIAGYHYTGSIAERADKNPIENLGVEPDIPYAITINDLQNKYADFAEAIHEAVRDLLNPS